MMAVILAVAGSARASPDGVSTHTALRPGTICGVYPPLWTRRLCTGLSERWLSKVLRSAAAQAIQMPRGPGEPAHAVPGAESDPAPEVMLTGSSRWSPTRSVLVTRPAARSTPATWLADQSEIQAVEPSMVIPPGWPNGTGIRARTVAGSSAGDAAAPGPAPGA